MKSRIAVAILMAALLGACSTRSISNSGYSDDGPYGGAENPFYRGEIDTLDLLVPVSQGNIEQAHIEAVLAERQPVVALLGQPLLVVQSGALVPDEPMLDALGRHFDVAPFSGIPSRWPGVDAAQGIKGGASYGERLRLAAAEGGYRRILIYWGKLEAERKGGFTKAVSWIPIVGSVVPEESQHMRIVLNAVVMDVVSGRWTQIAPEPIEDDAISASINRGSSDQDQVNELKKLGYAKLAGLVADQARPAPTNSAGLRL